MAMTGRNVSALFVQDDGVYIGINNIDAWTKNRDARLYEGPNAVIAHPPCQRYSKLGLVNYKRWGGEHNRPLNDRGLFASALASVNCWGGVLEHPAFTMAWPAYNIAPPPDHGWGRSGIGWVCEVWQSVYGHKAQKRTWLYYVGLNDPFDLCWDRARGTHQIGFQDQRGKQRNLPTLSKKEANSTPIRFRDELIKLAIHSQN